LDAACAALAHLHQTWMPPAVRVDVCPAVQRRLQSWQRWQKVVASGWRPAWQSLDPHADAARQLWQLVGAQIDDVPRLLSPWQSRPLPLQPCVCDLWHDHVLFTGESVTGLIDFGSAKEDHIAVDLARLLGSLVGDDPARWDGGMSAYSRVNPLSSETITLAKTLDRTGTIIAATNWLRWLYIERRSYDHPDAVQSRLLHLVQRLKRRV
jgi:Ser/Thr protein kinase RdoA (MazF antagonist)